MMALRFPARALVRCRSGVAAVEFALALPFFLALLGSGIEISALMMANLKVQRLATMTADLVARDGSSTTRISEAQIYDILSAMDVSSRPLNIRDTGRVIISAVLGEDTNNDGTADVNRIKWQRFDGSLTTVPRIIGCITSSDVTAAIGRQLRLGEPLFHTQVSYTYRPIFSQSLVRWFNIPTTITRSAVYRGRGAIYHPVQSVDGYPPKGNCTSATGL